MTSYNAPQPVSGEFATPNGLVAFDYDGDFTANGDELIIEHLLSLGLVQHALPKQTKKATTTEAAEPAADTEEK